MPSKPSNRVACLHSLRIDDCKRVYEVVALASYVQYV